MSKAKDDELMKKIISFLKEIRASWPKQYYANAARDILIEINSRDAIQWLNKGEDSDD